MPANVGIFTVRVTESGLTVDGVNVEPHGGLDATLGWVLDELVDHVGLVSGGRSCRVLLEDERPDGFRGVELVVGRGSRVNLATLARRRRVLSEFVDDDIEVRAGVDLVPMLPAVLEPHPEDVWSPEAEVVASEDLREVDRGVAAAPLLPVREPTAQERRHTVRFDPGARVLMPRTPPAQTSRRGARDAAKRPAASRRGWIPAMVAVGVVAMIAVAVAVRSAAPEPVTVCVDTRIQVRVDPAGCQAFEVSGDYVWRVYDQPEEAPAVGAPVEP